MASLLSRFTNFIPNTTILSNDHNQELNRIVNLLNGTTTNLKTVLKTSDAGDPPLELDQLSTGPIQKWFQGGVLKASITNDGSLSTTGNVLITNGSPQITLVDNVGNIGSDFLINKNGQHTAITRFGQADLLMDNATGVFSFAQIPVGPASDPTTDNQFARKIYIDSKKTAFYLGYEVQDPTAAVVAPTGLPVPVFICPDGVSITITKAHVLYMTGTHTSGGVLTFSWQKRTAASSWVTTSIIATATLDNTNSAQFVPHTNDIGDQVLLPGDTLELFITTRTGTVSERDVTAALFGTQKVF